MELYLYLMGVAALACFAAGVYLHLVRSRAERVAPPPLLNPPRKRKPGK